MDSVPKRVVLFTTIQNNEEALIIHNEHKNYINAKLLEFKDKNPDLGTIILLGSSAMVISDKLFLPELHDIDLYIPGLSADDKTNVWTDEGMDILIHPFLPGDFKDRARVLIDNVYSISVCDALISMITTLYKNKQTTLAHMIKLSYYTNRQDIISLYNKTLDELQGSLPPHQLKYAMNGIPLYNMRITDEIISDCKWSDLREFGINVDNEIK